MNSNKSISILGCGWLGFELAKYLVSLGFKVNGSTTSEEKLSSLENAGIQAFKIDLSDPIDQIDLDFFQSNILFLNIPPGRRHPQILIQYPDRVEKALKLAKREGVRHCILVSSTSVFESVMSASTNPDFPVYKTDVPNNSRASATALISGEDHLKKHYKSNGTVLRFGGLVGGNRLAGRFLSGKKGVKNGLAPVNMIHRDDCIKIIEQIIVQDKWGTELNAVADKHPSRSEFYQVQAEKYGFDKPTFVALESEEGKIIDNQWLKKSLNYEFIHSDPLQF